MESNKTLIYKNTPIKIELINLKEAYNNWSEELKIIYVLKGNILLESNGFKKMIKKDEFVVINSCDFLNIYNENKNDSYFLEILSLSEILCK